MDIRKEMDKSHLESLLKQFEGLSHLEVRARGDLMTLDSIDKFGNKYSHARLRRKSIHQWFLEMPTKNKWESTFMEGTIEELIELLIEKFPWFLAPR